MNHFDISQKSFQNDAHKIALSANEIASLSVDLKVILETRLTVHNSTGNDWSLFPRSQM